MFSLGHLECSFENSVEMFLRKSRIFFQSVSLTDKERKKKIKKIPQNFPKDT